MLPMIKNNESMAVDMLNDMGLDAGSYPSQISVEEQQKISILRAIINDPKLLLVDEPTSSLSQSGTINVMELLKNLKKDYTVLVFTDDMELFKYSDVGFNLNKGILCSS